MELKRVRQYLGYSQVLVSVATGVSVYRIAAAENNRIQLNDVERSVLEDFYKSKLRMLAELQPGGGR
jgi:transcriptional regulator with XRE-family HTH domain